jgi:hypothetical protein
MTRASLRKSNADRQRGGEIPRIGLEPEPLGALHMRREQKPKTPFVFSVKSSNKIFDFNHLPGGQRFVFGVYGKPTA